MVEVTGLRNPCAQINDFRPGLLNVVLRREEDGALVRKVGIMCIVLHGGPVQPRRSHRGAPARRPVPGARTRLVGALAAASLAGSIAVAVLHGWLGSLDGNVWAEGAALAGGVAAIALVLIWMNALLGARAS